VWLSVLVAAAVVLGPPGSAAAAARDLLPDLKMKPPVEMRITHQTTSRGPDRRLLRFTARMVNAGEGPFNVRGKRACSTSACQMTLKQRIRRSDGSARSVPTNQHAKFNDGDGHDHWHVLDVERYMLIPIDTVGDQVVQSTRAAKVGFCFFDTNANRLSLPGAPQQPMYGKPGCASRHPESLRINEGLSVGWLDLYPWDIAAQWIDTTGLPNGHYLLCETADPNDAWLETHENNNEAWAHIQITRDAHGNDHLSQSSSGNGHCAQQIPNAPAAVWKIDPVESEPVLFGQAAQMTCVIRRPA
jgi:hypothetical protein